MARFVVGRALQSALTMLVALAAVFALSRMAGSPVDVLLPLDASLSQRAALAEQLGLDKPVIVQFFYYLQSVATGNFGNSVQTGLPVLRLVIPSLINSVSLATASLCLALAFSLPVGVFAALYRDSWWAKTANFVAVVGQALPPFWSGTIAVLVFSVWLGWLPSFGASSWLHYILPAMTLAWFISGGAIRLLRSSMLEVLQSDYVKFARLKGLSEWTVLWRHALRNALLPTITFLGILYGLIITAAIPTEIVFSWPGLGRLIFQAAQVRDFPLIQATVLAFTLLVVVINLLLDVAYALIDPRIRA